jgi:hypothetical protein
VKPSPLILRRTSWPLDLGSPRPPQYFCPNYTQPWKCQPIYISAYQTLETFMLRIVKLTENLWWLAMEVNCKVRATFASDSRMWRAHPAWIWRNICVRCASCNPRVHHANVARTCGARSAQQGMLFTFGPLYTIKGIYLYLLNQQASEGLCEIAAVLIKKKHPRIC